MGSIGRPPRARRDRPLSPDLPGPRGFSMFTARLGGRGWLGPPIICTYKPPSTFCMGAYMSPSAPTSRGPGAREALADAALLGVDALLLTGAALRITRFATTDVLGGWVLADPLKAWAEKHEPGRPFGYAAPASAWRHRLVSALDCPFCVGTQATIAVGAALALTASRTAPATSPRSRRSPLGRALRAACATLGAAYVVGHVSHRIDSAASTTAPAPAPAAKDSK
nr:MAG TPA: Protein of unknown function (DUF1360) [Caudoviricetes sp.]